MPKTSSTCSKDEQRIGARIRELRVQCGISQYELGKRLSISHQQLQKYEQGINRVTASRLYQIASILQQPINSFFEPPSAHFAESSRSGHIKTDRDLTKLMQLYPRIRSRKFKKLLLTSAQIFTEKPEEEDSAYH